MADRIFTNPPVKNTAGKQTNPTDQFVMADTGAFTSQGRDLLVEARVVVGASAAGLWAIQRRNAANSSTVSTDTVYTAAGQSCEVVLCFTLANGERIRVTSDGGLTGTASATIQAEVVA